MCEQKFKDPLSSTLVQKGECWTWNQRLIRGSIPNFPGYIPTRGNIFSKFYNPNLHNIARSDRIGFMTKKPVYLEISQYGNTEHQKPNIDRMYIQVGHG